MSAAPPTATPGNGRDPAWSRLAAWDRAASRRIAVSWPHPRWFTLPLAAISLTANYGVLWLVLAALPWAFGAQRGPLRFAYVAGSVLGTQFVTFLLKAAFDRRRPPEREAGPAQVIPLPHSRSFPSSHASMGAAGLLTAGSLYPHWWAPLAALVAVLAFSRVYLRVHYLADVLAGLALGAVIGVLVVALFPFPG
jgi:undecaprenyl-diphosphatase